MVRCDVVGLIELPLPTALPAPHEDEPAVRVELLNPVIPPVADIEIPGIVYAHPARAVELGSIAPVAPPLHHILVDLLGGVRLGVNDGRNAKEYGSEGETKQRKA
jgi:hypothetical protein